MSSRTTIDYAAHSPRPGRGLTRSIWLVVAREYRQYVARKSFWIGMLIGPLFFAGLMTLQVLSITMSPQETKRLVIVDRSGQIAGAVSEKLSAEKFKDGKPEYKVEIVPPAADSTAQYTALNHEVGNKELFAYLVIGEGLQSRSDFRLYMRNVNEIVRDKIDAAIEKTLVGVRLKAQNVAMTQEQLDAITKGVSLNIFKVSREGGATQKSFGGTYVAVLLFTIFMMMMIMIPGITMFRSILEEKSSRVIEVLLSSMTPFQLMMGKIIGTCFVGLTQVGVYALTIIIFSVYGMSSMPPGIAREIASAFSPALAIFFLIYFLLGFFLFLTMFAAIGSMVNSEQEAHSLQQPVMMLLVVPLYAVFFFINNPDSTLARVTSLIPFFTPIIMMMRITVLTPPAWEIALSIVLTLGTTIGVIWVAARIFRVGILMYGKKPNLPEIIRWVKAG